MTFQIRTNITSILYGKKEWRKKNGYRLPKTQQANNKE